MGLATLNALEKRTILLSLCSITDFVKDPFLEARVSKQGVSRPSRERCDYICEVQRRASRDRKKFKPVLTTSVLA